MTGTGRFKGLLFDFDETLVPEYDVANQIFDELVVEIADHHGASVDLTETLREVAGRHFEDSSLKAAVTEALGRVPGPWYAHEMLWDDKSPLEGVVPYVEGFRRQVWQDMFRAIGLEAAEIALELAAKWPDEMSRRRGPYPESDAVLRRLGERHRMAIITNGEQLVQAMKVEKSGLQEHFEYVVLGEAYGGKPNPEPFQAAMDLIGCEPHEVAMIGNNLKVDIAGARNLGIYSVWVNRHGTELVGEVVPDATVKDLRELLDLL